MSQYSKLLCIKNTIKDTTQLAERTGHCLQPSFAPEIVVLQMQQASSSRTRLPWREEAAILGLGIEDPSLSFFLEPPFLRL